MVDVVLESAVKSLPPIYHIHYNIVINSCAFITIREISTQLMPKKHFASPPIIYVRAAKPTARHFSVQNT